MGRSKFPGKPSKHCHRKRINVLPPTGELNQEGDSSSVTVIGASKENKQDDDLTENEGESTSETHKARPLKRRLSRKLSTAISKNGRQRNFMSKIRGKATLKNNASSRSCFSKGHVRKDATNFAGKFVLPTRSVHSSRVIKPNKRFIDLNETLNVKKKSLSKRPIKLPEDKSNNPDSDSKDKLAFSNGHRVILRQARLKLPNQISTQGPFSTNLHNGPGTIICGVCGAVRYYRFVKQARKFNIYSCESCRKFISKQIKRQNIGSQGSNVLICHMGQGSCYVPPVERSQHWKISKCAYRSRCPACWLKMCLKAYHLPLSLKQNLTQLLPRNMRGIDFSFSNSLPPILWQRNIENPLENSKSVAKQRPVRFKPQQISHSNVPVTSDVKRQKIDLKGPRVKHVCRSASIVLGQPLATFGGGAVEKKYNSDSLESVSEKYLNSDTMKGNDLCKVDIFSAVEEDNTLNSGGCKNPSDKTVLAKKERTRSLPASIIKETDSTSPPVSRGILLDYSQELNIENRFKAGFCLITTKYISSSAMCFLCGSAGIENILVCCLCCEPYHTFCVENYGIPVNFENDWTCIRCAPCQDCKGFDKSKISCPKCLKIYHNDCFSSKDDPNSPKIVCKACTKCQDCGMATAYNLTSFPGNMPLCLTCLDKRKVGMHCPICQHSFDKNSTGAKMLECSKCKKWVHADCEKLTSEQYDILKLLPASSSFSCSQCLDGSNCIWRTSVQTEMYKNFNRVLRLLVKNKSAKHILKRVEVKGSLFRKYVLKSNQDIDNNNYSKDIDKIYSFEESEKLQKGPSSSTVNTLLDIKNRLCEYDSVKKFNNDMLEALKLYDSEQIVFIYKSIFQSVFAWFCQLHEAAETTPPIPYYHIRLGHPQSLKKTSLLPGKDIDSRRCELCQNTGDGFSNQESRLLYCGNNVWVHANCALWSTNVYEQIDSHLQNVTEVIESCRNIRCTSCDRVGASIHCCMCKTSSYHFMCARKSDFYFSTMSRTCFCSKHPPENHEYLVKTDDDFEVNRILFVEQQQKEILRSEPENVTCLIGSLQVTSLGKIEPVVSDTSDAIIPTGFMCSRLFWSTKEPWKLVKYFITTSIQNPNCTTLTVDKNFTVDHSLGGENMERAMKELNDWRRVYEKKSDEVDSEDEEEKNGTELLSPELTDTILEDLPHDILDGISVQDIFPNFSYEDMLNLDNSNTDSISESYKKPEDEDATIEPPDTRSTCREWLKTKADSMVRSRVPPLSLTVSYKVDSTDPPVTKKRKLSKEVPSSLLLLQVDGGFDDESSSECDSPTRNNSAVTWAVSEEPVTCEKCQCTYRTQASYKRHLDSCDVLCTSESDSENVPENELGVHCEEQVAVPECEPVEVTVLVNEPTQPVLVQAFESYQSQVHTSVVNMVPEPTPVPPPIPATQQVTVQPTITIAEQAPPISISVPLCVGPSITPQIVQPSIEFQQAQAQPMTLHPMQQVLVQRPQPARRDPMVLQQIQAAPASNFVPFVDAFSQPQTSQSVQYVQLATQVQPQPQLLQIRSDGNVIGILPNIQPTTVIVQQPQQLVLDSTGTFGWTQQPQPQIYYGFETIVQNTVMQSQQFLPTPVPGVLTANSSYSTTTQVFQTSKLEPVLDVSSNSFVLVNPSGQFEIPQQFSLNQPAAVVTSQTPGLIYSSQPSATQKPIVTASHNCINLPTAPFLSDQNIPMNVVPPIPKQPTSHSRPMNRVLPMPTNAVRPPKKVGDATKLFPEFEKPTHIKLDDKFVFSKDLVKLIDTPKARNRKFEILDYKVIKSHPKTDVSQEYKTEEKLYKEFEPVEKIPKLPSYEPIKEIEKVKMEFFEKPIKPLNMFEGDKYLKLDSIKSLSALENRLKTFGGIHLQQRSKIEMIQNGKKLKMESITPKRQIDQSLLKHENNPIKDDPNLRLEIKTYKPENNIQKKQLGLSSPKMKLDRKNNEDMTVHKQQMDVSSPPKPEIKQQLQTESQIEVHMPEEILTDIEIQTIPVKQSKILLNQNTNEESQLSEKSLDMPKLEDIKGREGVKTEKPPYGFNIIQPGEVSNREISNELKISPPLLPVISPPLEQKPKEGTPEIFEDKPSTSSSCNPAPKQPLKKESDVGSAPSILFTMENKEEGFKYSSTSISDCWNKVLEAVQTARAAHNMPPLPTDGKHIKSVQITGLKSNHIKYLVEQLPGASKCVKYKPLFKFTPRAQDSAEICSHGFGAVRCQPHKSRNTEPNDMFSWLSSKHREPFVSLDSQTVQSRRVNNFPMAMKFKNLKLTSKYSVGVYRSRIHGKGLFCLRDIEPGEMVIEYAGEVIRSILTDKREKFYNSKGIGCYMFRVDDNFVVDATMKGNAARFINHSCDPNCYSKVVEIMGHKHIIIFALRRIASGEELTYDYKFPFEEDKIPCTCGARRCRKFLN